MTDPDEPSGPTIAVWREVAGRGTLVRLDQHPVAVYLARLYQPKSSS